MSSSLVVGLLLLVNTLAYDGLNDCEFVVKVSGNSSQGLDLTPLKGQVIILQEQAPNDQYYINFSPCGNQVSESCYTQGTVMAAQMTGATDSYGNGILAIWDNKQTQPTLSKTSSGADKFTFVYPPISSCQQGCDGGRQQEINFICDPNAEPYDKMQSKFYESDKVNGVCMYHLDLYTKYACPVSLGPTKEPTPRPTMNASCSGQCVSPIVVKEDGQNVIRYVMGDRSLARVEDGGNTIILKHGAQVQIAKEGASQYGPNIFQEYKLSGKTLSYTVDLSQISCSCNAAFYLVTMPGYGSNGQPTPGQYNDYYCDANDVGGTWCWEFDIMESNKYVTATTPHQCDQAPGGFISNCDRGGCGTNSHNVDGNSMCPGGCKINTNNPFKYSITFGGNIDVTLTQGANSFSYTACNNGGYISNMQQALDYGMVIVMSYWGNSYQTMSWLDQMTGCGGDCDTSGQAVFSNLEIS